MIWSAILASLLLTQFQAANQLYDAGKFAEAAAAYEKIEPKTAHVCFNLGNACFRQEQFGVAVLNYERARQLAPRDPDIRANLKFARQRLGLEDRERFVRSAIESRTAGEWSRYELAGLWLTILAVAGAIWLPRLRTGMILVAAVAGVVTVTTAAALVTQMRQPPAGIVIVTGTEARFAPLPESTAHFQLGEGTKVSIREDRGQWLLVERADRQHGWVKTDAVGRIALQ